MVTDKRQHWLNIVYPDGVVNFGDSITEGMIVPSGNTAERPAIPQNGTIRFNTTTSQLEAYVNGTWENLVGGGGGGGSSSFIGLSDTPGSYPIGRPLLRVNLAQTGLEYIDGNTLWLPLAGGTMGSGSNITMTGGTLKNVPSPSSNNDVANKEYVDGIAAGLAVKESVHSATTGPINLATQGLSGIDGHAPYLDGDRVLVKDQVDPTENGIYDAHAGPWTRSIDMDGTPSNEVTGGTTTYVQDGTVNGNTSWVVIHSGDINVGVDAMNWSLISSPSTQNLWQTISADAGSQIATSPTDTLTIAGGTGISTAIVGTTLTVTNDSPNVDQNLYQIFAADSGTTPAPSTPTDFLNVNGAGTVTTSIVGNTLTITGAGGGTPSILSDTDGDTRIRVEAAADEDIIRFDTGSTPAGFGAVANIMRLSSSRLIVSMGTATSASVGAPINMTAGNGVDDGGDVSFTAGVGGTTNGGNVSITAGAGPSAGGDVSLLAGASSTSGLGGDINITSGFGTASDGGNVNITTGSGATNGGDIDLILGAGTAPGNVKLRTTLVSSSLRPELRFFEATNNGSNYIGLSAPASVPSTRSWSLPQEDPTTAAGKLLTTDSSGQMSFSESIPYDIAVQIIGVAGTTTPQRVFHMIATTAFTIDGTSNVHRGHAVTGPTGSNAIFTIYVNGVSKGTATFTTAGGDTQSITFSLTATSVSPGDLIWVSLTTADSNDIMADVMMTIKGSI